LVVGSHGAILRTVLGLTNVEAGMLMVDQKNGTAIRRSAVGRQLPVMKGRSRPKAACRYRLKSTQS
jgi:hypothetical protein